MFVLVKGIKDKHIEFGSKYIVHLIGLEIYPVSDHGPNFIPALALKNSEILSSRPATFVPDFVPDLCPALVNGSGTTFFPPAITTG